MITGIMEGLGLKDGAPPESDGEKMWTRFVIDKGKKYGEGGYGATYGAMYGYAYGHAYGGGPADAPARRTRATKHKFALMSSLF